MLQFEWLEPESLEEVKKALSYGEAETRLVSGGTALSLIMKQGIFQPRRLVSLKKVKHQLNYIQKDEAGNLRIGAMTTLKEMEASSLLAQEAPVIVEALHHVANPRIRYVASIGGNLSHGDPHLDLPPILLALDAKVKLESAGGERWVELGELFLGYYVTSIEPREILTEVLIPRPDPELKGTYLKYTTLSNDDWPTVGVAAFVKRTGGKVEDVRIAVSAVMDTVTRLHEVEGMLQNQIPDESLIEQAAQKAFERVEPTEDLRGSVWYKKEMVKVHVKRALKQLLM